MRRYQALKVISLSVVFSLMLMTFSPPSSFAEEGGSASDSSTDYSPFSWILEPQLDYSYVLDYSAEILAIYIQEK